MNWKEMSYKRTALLLAVAVGAVSVAGCTQPGSDTAQPAEATAAAPVDNRIAVDCELPKVGSLSRTTEFVGRIAVAEPVKVYCKTGGRISKLNFAVGDHVKQGQVMFQLDTEDLQDAVQSAYYTYQSTANSADTSVLNAQYAWDTAAQSYETAKKNLDDLHDTYDDLLDNLRKEMNSKAAALKEAQAGGDAAAIANAQAEYTAAKNSYTTTRSTYNSLYETYRTNKQNARTGAEHYKDTYDSVQAENGAAQIMIDQAKFNYDRAVRNLNYAIVYAPVSGVVTAKTVSVNDMISSSVVVYTIDADSDDPVISFNISEDAAKVLRVGSHVTITYNGGEYDAVIYEIATQAGSSGLYAAKARPETVLGDGRSGAVVKVRAATAETSDAIILSLDDISYDGNTPYVLVYQNGYARRRDLQLGVTTNTEAEILSGLSATDPIITTWHPNLENGSEVVCDAFAISTGEKGE